MPRYGSGNGQRKSQGKSTHGTSRNNSQKNSAPEFRGFVKFPRDRATKEEFSLYLNDGGNAFTDLSSLLESGFKITLNADRDNDSVHAAAFSNDAGRDDSGLAISVWQETVYDAITLIAFLIVAKGYGSLSSEFFTPPDVNAKKTFWDS